MSQQSHYSADLLIATNQNNKSTQYRFRIRYYNKLVNISKMDQQNTFTHEIEDQLLSYSENAQQQEPDKIEYKASRLKDLFPSNYYEEMSYFLQHKTTYNPHFDYKTVVAPQYKQVHYQYEHIANKILVNDTYAPSTDPILAEEQVLEMINDYLQKMGLENYVQVVFSAECLSRTSVLYFKNKIVLKVRLPLSYTKVSLEGTLHHQIGTHIVRYLNHKENSERKPTKKSKIFEEGFAAINQLITEQKPFLFKSALRYNAVIHASKSSFVEVFKYISKYIQDEADCWRETVRAKRGFLNTQKPGAYSKDQNYFIGAIDILRNRSKIDFQRCFYSKLSADEGKNIEKGVLPPFMDTEQKRKIYAKKIEAIALCNFVDNLSD